MEAILMNAAAQ